MNITAEFQRDYGLALRNRQLNESEIKRNTEKLTSTGGLPADVLADSHFDKIIQERNARVAAKARKTFRRLVCGVCMVAPISAFIAGAVFYVVVL
jgi:hypothetical protein